MAVQGRSREQERQRCILTLAELDPLPEACNTYKGVGRACVLKARSPARARIDRGGLRSQLCAPGQAGACEGAARRGRTLRRRVGKAEGARARVDARVPSAPDRATPQANKERLESQAEDIEKNIKELLKTNEALARQIMAVQ